MADIMSAFSGMKMNWGMILWAFVGIVLIIAIAVVIKLVKDKKMFDILVEVTPSWSIKESITHSDHVNQSKFSKIINNKPQRYTQIDGVQDSTSYFTPGAYLFDKEKGIYYIRFKDKAKTKTQAIPYNDPVTKKPFFKHITFGKYRRYIHLMRYGPDDYKPIMTDFDVEHLHEIKNVYDSESTYVAIKTQEEVINRFRKGNKWLAFAPWIGMAVMVIVVLIGMYMQWQWMKDFTKELGTLVSQLGEFSKALMLSRK
jgi:hypothetical protein